jgi:hypothetical protein
MSLRRLTLLVLIILLFTAFLHVTVKKTYGEAYSSAVGVKLGDWVKYKVTNSGADTIWYPGTGNALWVKVEVIDFSDANVTVRETVHNEDGNEAIRDSSWNLENDKPYGRLEAYTRYIIVANHSAGDKIGEHAIFLGNNATPTYVDVILNSTELRSFGETTKEVNYLKFCDPIPEDDLLRNDTWEICWEKQSGFLVELKLETHHIGYEDYSRSTLEIEDTNMWIMGKTHPTWGEVGMAVIIPASLIVAYMSLRSRNHRKKNETDIS